MEKLKISVIVPIYKVEKYLDKCVQSIVEQTYTNLEIILVDDGSPDRCGEMCDEWAKKDSRIKVIHKNAGGVSRARNTALDIATGDILAFVDSDDWIELNAYEMLVKFLVENDLDIVFMGVKKIRDNKEYVVDSYYPDKYICEPDKIMRKTLRDEIGGQPWRKICRKSCFEGVRFPEGRVYEDLAISYMPFLKAKKNVGFINQPLYVYRLNEEGISLSKNPAKAYQLHLAFLDHLHYAREKSIQDVDCCLAKTTNFGMGVIHNSLNNKWNTMECEINEVNTFMNRNIKDILKCKDISLKRKLNYLGYYILPSIYIILGKLLKNKKKARKWKKVKLKPEQ